VMAPETALIFLMAMAVGAGAWYRAIGTREAAVSAAAKACRDISVQFLDDTVAFERLCLRRSAGGLRIESRFRFEYSREGDERRLGHVRCVGRRAVAVQVEDDEGTTILL